ncbi:putative transposase [Shimwellia blattae DSM 4481 = NBRC 105725]|uniref:Putative transposase n=1 Tax=Shimwellia blattae (strain ATCC 29907 / DSM 4481 / JCM 1650 / NBRC 105725 / CDC 9005-74) TaxID=630626 RepID=I2B9I0_SHIBC|nr:putative transposase [Shimwellia blattae DSM 4481 = NBRC 105725]
MMNQTVAASHYNGYHPYNMLGYHSQRECIHRKSSQP